MCEVVDKEKACRSMSMDVEMLPSSIWIEKTRLMIQLNGTENTWVMIAEQ